MSALDLVTLIACMVTLVFSAGTVVVLISSYFREARARRKSSARRQENRNK